MDNGEPEKVHSVKITNLPSSSTLDPWSQIAIMLISALGFISAFAWNSTIMNFFESRISTKKDYRVYLVYAIVVTIFSAVAIYFIAKYTNTVINKKLEEEEEGIITG